MRSPRLLSGRIGATAFIAKELLKEFQKMSATNGSYVAKRNEIRAPLSQHIKASEGRDMPALEEAFENARGCIGVYGQCCLGFSWSDGFAELVDEVKEALRTSTLQHR